MNGGCLGRYRPYATAWDTASSTRTRGRVSRRSLVPLGAEGDLVNRALTVAADVDSAFGAAGASRG